MCSLFSKVMLWVFVIFNACWAFCIILHKLMYDTVFHSHCCLVDVTLCDMCYLMSVVLRFVLQSLFARNFYNFKYLALCLAFFINIILLFYKVTLLYLLIYYYFCNMWMAVSVCVRYIICIIFIKDHYFLHQGGFHTVVF